MQFEEEFNESLTNRSRDGYCRDRCANTTFERVRQSVIFFLLVKVCTCIDDHVVITSEQTNSAIAGITHMFGLCGCKATLAVGDSLLCVVTLVSLVRTAASERHERVLYFFR